MKSALKNIKKTKNNEWRKIYDFKKSNNNIFYNFAFYVINNRNNGNPSGHHFPYHYGIGVNKEHNRILYYYDCPD